MKHRFNLWRDCLYPLLRKVVGKKHDCCDKLKNCARCVAQMDESTMGQVKHGHWVKYGSPLFSEWECSECGERHTGNDLPDTCLHCKAKMDEVEE